MTGDITILAPPPPGYPNLNNDTSNTTFIDIVWDSSNFMFSPVIYQVSLVLSRFGTNVPVMSPRTVCAVCNILSIIVYVHYISLPLPSPPSLSLSLSLPLPLPLSLSPSLSLSPIQVFQNNAQISDQMFSTTVNATVTGYSYWTSSSSVTNVFVSPLACKFCDYILKICKSV